jgi:hypothetical protein
MFVCVDVEIFDNTVHNFIPPHIRVVKLIIHDFLGTTMMNDRAMQSRVVLGVLMVAALTYGWTTSYPDNVYISYGFPLRWGNFQMVTVAGRVDVWAVEVSTLFIDLAVWTALLILFPELVRAYQG